MNLPFTIARRYLFAKKSHNAINFITLISVLVVALGTTALVLILSVFNGLGSLITSLYGTFDPDIKVEAKNGKYIEINSFPFEKINKIEGVANYCQVLEDMALLKYQLSGSDNPRQYIARIKGVSPEFIKTSGIDTVIIDGHFLLQNKNYDFAVVGNGIAGRLQLHLNDFNNPINVYFPRGEGMASLNPMEAFTIENILPSGVFSIQEEYDDQIVLTSLRFAQRLMNKPESISALEIKVKNPKEISQVQKDLSEILGNNFSVKNRFQQKEALYKIMSSEKWSSFMILGFILLIAIFNVVGSITVLIIEKRKDIGSLKNMGADNRLIRKIFFMEGMLISIIGAIAGLTLGALLCYLQQKFGFVPMDGNFAVQYFPVEMHIADFAAVFGLIFSIGFFATLIPVLRISKKYLLQ